MIVLTRVRSVDALAMPAISAGQRRIVAMGYGQPVEPVRNGAMNASIHLRDAGKLLWRKSQSSKAEQFLNLHAELP